MERRGSVLERAPPPSPLGLWVAGLAMDALMDRDLLLEVRVRRGEGSIVVERDAWCVEETHRRILPADRVELRNGFIYEGIALRPTGLVYGYRYRLSHPICAMPESRVVHHRDLELMDDATILYAPFIAFVVRNELVGEGGDHSQEP